MPDAEDRDRLPYVNAVVKETLRWHTAVPLGVARCVSVDDENNGYGILGGATVIVGKSAFRLLSSLENVATSDFVSRAIMHDDKVYPDPERFSPELFEGRIARPAGSHGSRPRALSSAWGGGPSNLLCMLHAALTHCTGYVRGDTSQMRLCSSSSHQCCTRSGYLPALTTAAGQFYPHPTPGSYYWRHREHPHRNLSWCALTLPTQQTSRRLVAMYGAGSFVEDLYTARYGRTWSSIRMYG